VFDGYINEYYSVNTAVWEALKYLWEPKPQKVKAC